MKITNRYIELVHMLNNSKTEEEHGELLDHLKAWLEGVKDCGKFISMQMAEIECGQGRKNNNGIWLDWEAHNGPSSEYRRAINS
ncbi:MAG: hypothetical protein WC756_21625 [Taibaiella sp.]|jgi:hypothetical protein